MSEEKKTLVAKDAAHAFYRVNEQVKVDDIAKFLAGKELGEIIEERLRFCVAWLIKRGVLNPSAAGSNSEESGEVVILHAGDPGDEINLGVDPYLRIYRSVDIMGSLEEDSIAFLAAKAAWQCVAMNRFPESGTRDSFAKLAMQMEHSFTLLEEKIRSLRHIEKSVKQSKDASLGGRMRGARSDPINAKIYSEMKLRIESGKLSKSRAAEIVIDRLKLNISSDAVVARYNRFSKKLDVC